MIFLILFSFVSLAAPLPSTFSSLYLEIENAVTEDILNYPYASTDTLYEDPLSNSVFIDEKKLIRGQFKPTAFFYPSTYFWFTIYTKFNSSQVVLHDRDDISLVYKIINFNALKESNIHRFAKSKIQTTMAIEQAVKLKKILLSLKTKTSDFNFEQKAILDAIKKSRYTAPKKLKERILFFKKLANNIRTQTGQSDMIYKALITSSPYRPFLLKSIRLFKLPEELLAIPFLESSFNVDAVSKVGAKGIWQFMPFIANLFMPRISNKADHRLNPFISSIAAFHLLRENKLVVKNWDLAVTAYNSGTNNIVKASRKLKIPRKKLHLETLIKRHVSKDFGFASQNFYSSFLALVHALAYKNALFKISGVNAKATKFRNDIKLYLSNCKFIPSKKLSSLKVLRLNQHLLKPKSTYNRGTIISSDIKLSPNQFTEIPSKIMQAFPPKKWYYKTKLRKCNLRS